MPGPRAVCAVERITCLRPVFSVRDKARSGHGGFTRDCHLTRLAARDLLGQGIMGWSQRMHLLWDVTSRASQGVQDIAGSAMASGMLRSAGLLGILVAHVTASAATNLLGNPGFENGLTGWTAIGSGVSILREDVHSGSQAVRLVNAEVRQGWIRVVPGQAYKAFAWVRLVSESGKDWGGFRVEVVDAQWRSLAHSGSLLAETHGTNWFKIALRFVATTPTALFVAGYFGGNGRTQVVHLDDCAVLEDGPDNLPPAVEVALWPTEVVAPGTQRFQLTGEDPDGAIVQVVWEFGDGTRALGWSGQRHVGVPGQYTARVFVADDEGAVVVRQIAWSATRPGWPEVQITEPAQDGLEVHQTPLLLCGTVSGLDRVEVSTDRGFYGVAPGSNSWALAVPLAPGWNLISVGSTARRVRYVPAGELAVTGLTESQPVIERWEPLEITFDLSHSAATHPHLPYESNAPPGLAWVDGVTVEALFTSDGWKTVYRRPGFLWQSYGRAFKSGQEWLYPTNRPRWCVRFAPPETGLWQYRIEVIEARGRAVSETRTFRVVAPTDPVNRGPIRVSARDSRYFEFANGTPFLGSGHGIAFAEETYSYDAERKFEEMGWDNQNFFRWWISGHVWGSAWQPWASRTLPYEGTVPPTGLSLESAFGHGLAAWKLDHGNPILFQGFHTGHAGLIPGRTYRVRVRWRTDQVTGPARAGHPYGVCVKFVGWPEPAQTLGLPVLVRHAHGDTPWHVAVGHFTASNDLLPNLALILENVTGGRAFVDEVAVEEVLGDGTHGPNLLRSSRANAHTTFDPRRGAALEQILREAQRRGLYFKLVISEKQEYLLNRLSPAGLPDPHGQHFNGGPGSPTRRLHEYYWRHLSARYGAFRSVHSWELVNEEAPAPGQHFELTAHFARWADADGNPHPVSTSTWAGLATNAWKHPASAAIHYADFHCYVRHTGWIEPKAALAHDSARFFHEYDLAARAAGFGKPVTWGEMGIDGPRTTDEEEPDLAQDTNGVWLHKIQWARCGPGGVYPLYWWTENIFRHRLHNRYGAWHRFMADIPLNNGRYEDAVAVSSNPKVRVLGQKDTVAGRAHLWVDNREHTWRAVVEGRSPSPQSVSLTVAMGPPGARYRLDWYDTATGLVERQEMVTADRSGHVTFAITRLLTDTAVKLTRALSPRAQWRLEHFGTPENVGAAADGADPDGDGLINLLEYALGGDPWQIDAHLLPPHGRLLFIDGEYYLALTYRQSKGATDLRFEVQAAGMPLSAAWSGEDVVVWAREDAGPWWWVTARDLMPVHRHPHRFLRLLIGEP